MKDKKIEDLKKEYREIPIPDQLDFVVKKALKDGGINTSKKNSALSRMNKIAAGVAASVLLMTAAVNGSPAFAKTLSEIPVVGSMIEVLNFRQYTVDEGNFQADINTPQIKGLDNENLQNSLNTKYLLENQELYRQFMAEMGEMQKQGGGHAGVSSGYQIKTDNDTILSVGRYVVVTKASAAESIQYDTIDKQRQILLTLPSLFKDDRYVDIISENIKQQMVAQMKSDEGKIYWIEVPGEELMVEPFEEIARNQNFYINPEGKLVISFDEYEVAPGYMGMVEFVIPTEVIADVLVGNDYIK